LWPVREKRELPKQVARAIRGNRDYTMAALDLFHGQAPGQGLAVLRGAAGMASNNAEASLQRLIDEPHAGERREEEPAMTILTCLRRLAGVAATLSHMPTDKIDAAARIRLEQLKDWLGSCLSAIGDAIERGVAPPDLPPPPETSSPNADAAPSADAETQLLDHELARLARQIGVLHAGAIRFAGF
jgi:uncharacterized membrane protein YccC